MTTRIASELKFLKSPEQDRAKTGIGHECRVNVRLDIVTNQRDERRSASDSGPITELELFDCYGILCKKNGCFADLDYSRLCGPDDIRVIGANPMPCDCHVIYGDGRSVVRTANVSRDSIRSIIG